MTDASTEETVDDRPPSDWDEQDLLTIDEASERLVNELGKLRQLAGTESNEEAHRQLAARVDRLEAALKSITSGPTEVARI